MATTSLGRLTLDLMVQTASFTEPLTQAERKAKSAGKGIADSLDVAAIAVSALGGAIAGLSIAELVNYSDRVIQAGSDIQKFSKLANSSVRDFQYYAKGAEIAGISIESFADKMKDMQDRIGDFQQTGGGPLADFFENIAPRVGVTIQQFQKLSGPEALQLFYNSLEKAGASTNDMKFYMEAIISDSSLLIPLLEKGGEGFKKWGEAAEKAGAIMSDDLVKSLAEAKENLQLMDLQWQGVEARLVNSVVPAIETVIEHWDDIKAVTIAVSAGIATRFVPALVVATYQLGQTAIFAVRAGVGLASFARSAGVATGFMALLGGPAGIAMLATQALVAGGTYYALKKATDESNASLDTQGKTISELVDHYNTLSEAKKRAFAYDELVKLNDAKETYADAANQVAAYASSIANVANISDQSAIKVEAWRKEFLAGGITADELANRIGGLADISDVYNSHMVKYAIAAEEANAKLKDQNLLVNTLTGAGDKVIKSQQDQAKAVNDSAKAWQSLTQKQREYISQINQDAERDNYVKYLVDKGGFSVDKANAFAEAQVAANEGNAFKKGLPQAVVDATLKNFNRKNYTFGKPELEAIARAQGIAKANNFAQIEGLYGLPAGTLAALILQESGANAGARSHTGATGLFQTTSVFRKQYGLNAKSSTEEIATAAAKDLSKHMAEFGAMDKALMAYNAGAGGLRTYMKGGLSDSKRKEVAGYAPGFQKWFAGVSGKSTVDNSILMPTQADQLELINKAAESQKAIDDAKKEVDARYYTEAQRLAKEHQDNVDKITLAYAGTPQLKEKLAQEDALYAAQIAKLTAEKEQEYNQYFSFETDRIKQIERDYDIQKQLVNANVEYDKTKKAEITAALERQKQQEIAWEKLEQEQRINDASSFLRTELENMQIRFSYERQQILANSQISKDEQQKRIALSQAQEQLSKLDTATQASVAWDSTNAGLNGSGDLYQLDQERLGQTSQSLALADAQAALAESAAEQEAIWQAHKDRMFMIDQNYELNKAALGAKTASETLGGMADLMGGLMGEQSAAYKTMFAMSKAFAVAQAIMNAPQTFSNVYTSASLIPMIGPYIAPVLAGAAVAVQVAQAAQIKSVNLTGMAHDGIGNVPKEGTWLLDGGERVLNPNQNKDLTNYLSNQKDSGPQVVVYNNSKANVDTEAGDDGKVYVTIEDIYNPNSKYSQAMQESFNVSRNRG